MVSCYVPRRTAVVAGDWCVLQKVQPHVVVKLLRRTGVKGLRKVLHLCHEVIHVLLHRGEIQREALGGITPVCPVSGRRRWASRLWVAATPKPPCAKSSGLHQYQQQHWWNHSDQCHLCDVLSPNSHLKKLTKKKTLVSFQKRQIKCQVKSKVLWDHL